MFLRRIYVLKINDSIKKYDIRSNEEINNVFREPNLVGVIRAKSLSWIGFVLKINITEKYVLKWKP